MYRVFSKTAHAEEFVGGAIRFGHLNAYRAIEQAGRRDPSEGFGRHREFRADRRGILMKGGRAQEIASPGEITKYSESGNPIFLYCLTMPPDQSALARICKEFGDVLVEIADMDRLVGDIRSALDQNDPWQRNVVPQLWSAVYNKGELIDTKGESDPFEAMKRAATQKAPEYAYQHEHRIVLFSHGLYQVHGPVPDYLTVRLPKPPEYLRILRRPL